MLSETVSIKKSGPVCRLKHPDAPIKYLSLFLHHNALDLLVKSTNSYANHYFANESRGRRRERKREAGDKHWSNQDLYRNRSKYLMLSKSPLNLIFCEFENLKKIHECFGYIECTVESFIERKFFIFFFQFKDFIEIFTK